ncbi:uncharacterized protein STEHIDRAFT_123575 [Stereum hirsutum FP-91666 SS1]|uniref:uncharacterized protein n=1 Tax=Stereum hirsutum (strain FP-91666) TaxID=721885 RepID=UPI0004449C8A|nr:uncharacterized protein STEHIDRAFT_123575 [Stereum hirsutum FP-91666 SS1]EIM84052.1 hypothetical protein STEHIDRAFT_123575 [Stereum hirsutum FP-91666 SS1]
MTFEEWQGGKDEIRGNESVYVPSSRLKAVQTQSPSGQAEQPGCMVLWVSCGLMAPGRTRQLARVILV